MAEKEMFNLEFVIFDFPVGHLHDNTQKAWEYLTIKLLREIEVKMQVLMSLFTKQ